MGLKTEEIVVSRLHCPTCALQLERRVAAVEGVQGAQVDLLQGQIRVSYAAERIGREELSQAVARISGRISHAEDEGRENRWEAILTGAAGILLGAGIALQLAGGGAALGTLLGRAFTLSSLFYGLGAVVGGLPIARQGLSDLFRRLWGIDLLVMIAILGATALGELFEAASLSFLFGVAEWLEDQAAGRARRSIRDLLDRAPKRATVRRGGRELSLPVEAISPGEIILVRPGETIGLDGVVRKGASWVNEAAITGESIPAPKKEGDPIYAGTQSEGGFLEIEVTRPAEESTLAKIGRLVEEAKGEKAPVQRLVDRFARYYTPAVVGIAILVAVIPPFLGFPLRPWFLRALTLLVIACPCALAISTPAAMVSALSMSARRGNLVRGGAALEAIGKVRIMAMDKTGTLTTGELEAEAVALNGTSLEEVLRVAAALEAKSEHPIARAILRRAEGLPLPEVEEFQALPGKGIRGRVDGREYCVGRPGLFSDIPHAVEEILKGKRTTVLVGTERRPLGAVLLTDRIRPEARRALADLRELGIKPVLVTGDRESVAGAVAQALRIREVHAGLLPDEKVKALQDLHAHGVVIMVGDGVNDAPALAAADIGIAMGASGTDVALETADVVLMGDDLAKLPELVVLSRRALAVVRGNIAVALALKLAVAALAFAGMASLALAVLVGDVGATILVTANALRLARSNPRVGHPDAEDHGD